MSQTIAPVLGEATVQELRESVRGRGPDARTTTGTRRPAASGTARTTAAAPRSSSGAPAPPTWSAAIGFARSNHLTIAVRGGGHSVAGLLDLRRRHRDRSLADEERAGRSRRSPRNGRRRRRVGGRRPRDAGARPRNDRRSRLVDRRRRLHARRRHRLADAQVRPRLRQPRRAPTSSPRTAASSTRARRRTPICSGACAAAAATSASSRSSSSDLHHVGPMVYAGPIFYPADADRDLLHAFREWSATRPTRSRRSSTSRPRRRCR